MISEGSSHHRFKDQKDLLLSQENEISYSPGLLSCRFNNTKFEFQMLLEAFKKKQSQCYSLSEEESQTLKVIEHWDDQSQTSRAFFCVPRSLGDSCKIFDPSSWSLRDFQIGLHLGKGKYGHVYLARQRRSKHIVALKALSKKQLVQEEMISQVRRQIEIHSHLRHENIAQMYGFFFDKKRIYIILEYASGGELYKRFVMEKRFEEKTVSRYIRQVTAALQYMHAQDIIHRDLKPENLLLCGEDTVKMTDFGWSVHASRNRSTFCGTMDYICPEMVDHRAYDTRIDMWMLGVLTFELAAGAPPFEGASRPETYRRIKMIDYQCPEHFSPELTNFVQRLLIKDPKKRMTQEDALSHPFLQNNL